MRKLRIVATLVFSVSIAALAQEAAPQSQSSPAPRVIDLKSADGTVLKATYFAAPKPGPGAILYHQSNRTRQSWAALAAQLAAAGILRKRNRWYCSLARPTGRKMNLCIRRRSCRGCSFSRMKTNIRQLRRRCS